MSNILDTELFGRLPLPDPAADGDAAAILARARELAGRAKAPETLRAYRAGWAQWCGFCERMGYHPLAGDAQAVAFFLAHLSRSRSLATVRSRLAAVLAAHRIAGIALDARSGPIASVLDGFKREQGVRPLKQAAPVLLDVLPRLLAGRDARDRAILLTGFGGALRRSELVALDVEDLDFAAQGVLLRLRRSKTDQQGRGELIALHRGAEVWKGNVTGLLFGK